MLGLCLLSVTMVCWEIMLSKGQEWDWLGDPFFRVQTLLILFVALPVRPDLSRDADRQSADQFPHAARQKFPLLLHHHFLRVSACSMPTRPPFRRLLQSLFGYDATTSGLVLSPAGIGAVMMLFIVGMLLARGVDARYLMAAGLLVLAVGNYLDVADEPGHRPLAGGLAARGGHRRPVDDFAPLNVAAFLYIPRELRGAAVGLLALLRNEGGSVGTSVAQTIQERREQFHTLRLNENLDPLNPAVSQFLSRARHSSCNTPAMLPCRGK